MPEISGYFTLTYMYMIIIRTNVYFVSLTSLRVTNSQVVILQEWYHY